MTRVMIVGAGQSGLCLANGLLDQGCDVTLITGKTSDETRTGRLPLAQFTLPRGLAAERELGLDNWSFRAPPLRGIRQPLYSPGAPAPLVVTGRFDGVGVAVDPRVKMAEWLERFEDRGGTVVIHGVTVSDLDYFTRMYDLIVLAVGEGELGALFAPDPNRFGGAHPRVVTQAIVEGFVEAEDAPEFAECISAPQGRVVFSPILTASGHAHAICVMDEPGGRLDGTPLLERGGRHGPSSTEVTDWIVRSLSELFPEYEGRVSAAQPVDATSATVRRVQPQVRNPVGTLPSGGRVLGSADVVITTDPIAAQSWNLSTMCAGTYMERIRDRDGRPFTETWMHETFETFYAEEGYHCALLSDMLHHLWEQELPDYFQDIVGAALTYPEVADRWVRGVDDPSDYQEWFLNEEGARSYLKEVAARHG